MLSAQFPAQSVATNGKTGDAIPPEMKINDSSADASSFASDVSPSSEGQRTDH